MIKDYKARSSTRKKKDKPYKNTAAGFVFGSIFGFALCGVVVYYNTSTLMWVKNLPPEQQSLETPTVSTNTPPEPVENSVTNYGFYDALEQGTPVSPTQYILQGNSFNTSKNAQVYKKKILRLGHQAKIKKIKSENNVLHQVWLGSYSKKQASQIQRELKKIGIEMTVIREAAIQNQ